MIIFSTMVFVSNAIPSVWIAETKTLEIEDLKLQLKCIEDGKTLTKTIAFKLKLQLKCIEDGNYN